MVSKHWRTIAPILTVAKIPIVCKVGIVNIRTENNHIVDADAVVELHVQIGNCNYMQMILETLAVDAAMLCRNHVVYRIVASIGIFVRNWIATNSFSANQIPLHIANRVVGIGKQALELDRSWRTGNRRWRTYCRSRVNHINWQRVDGYAAIALLQLHRKRVFSAFVIRMNVGTMGKNVVEPFKFVVWNVLAFPVVGYAYKLRCPGIKFHRHIPSHANRIGV